jgi:hypothetical protein
MIFKTRGSQEPVSIAHLGITRTVSDLTEWYPPACNTMMFKLWNTGILAS